MYKLNKDDLSRIQLNFLDAIEKVYGLTWEESKSLMLSNPDYFGPMVLSHMKAFKMVRFLEEGIKGAIEDVYVNTKK